MDNDCLPCLRRSSTTLFDCLLFNSHDLAFDLSAPQRKSFRALRHHVTNVRQQLTVMGCQRGSLFPYPIPCIFYTLTAKNNFTASFFFKLCINIYFLFFNFISHQWLQITQCWKTTVGTWCNRTSHPTLDSKNCCWFVLFRSKVPFTHCVWKKSRQSCPWTVLASVYSFTGFVIQKQERVSSISSQQVTEISTQLRKIGGLYLCAPFITTASSTLFNRNVQNKLKFG